MRNLTKLLMTAGLAVACVSFTLAQQPRQPMGGFQQISEGVLLGSKPVQTELKLTDEQKEKLTKLNDKLSAMRKDLFKDGKFDREAFAKVNEESKKLTGEYVKSELKPEQSKRLKQIYLQTSLQFGGLSVFTNEEIQTELKLTADQKEKIKTIVGDTQKDGKEIMDGAGRDPAKLTAAREKISKLNKEATEKITATYTKDQEKAWKDMMGEKIELKREDLFPMRPRPNP